MRSPGPCWRACGPLERRLQSAGEHAEPARVRGDSGAIVLGWLTKLALLLGVLGIFAFDGISLVHTHLTASDAATTAANAAAENFKTTKNVQLAYNAAIATVGTNPDATIETTTFHIGSDGVVTLRLHLKATTLILRHIPPLRHFEDAAESGTGTPTF